MEIKLKCSDYTKNVNFKEAVKNIFDFNIGTALTEVVGISQSKEMKAFELLFNTFKTTNTQLKKELGQAILNKTTGLSVISAEFEIAIKNYFEQEITITKDFFENVLKYNPAYLKESYKLFKLNLKELQIPLPDNFEYNYYTTYRKNLQKEFEENSETYKELIDFFNNPIYEQNKVYDKQINHYQTIKNFFVSPLQADVEDCKESLKDLYIEPYFDFYKNSTTLDFSDDTEYEPYKKDFKSPTDRISIHNFLKNYFFKGIKHDDLKENHNMLFLLGQPGQGKTSFCYKLIYDYLEDNSGLPNTPIYFIKIRELIAKNFINNPFLTINKHLSQNIKFEEDDCILILDGLDEAYMAGGLNDNDLKHLYDRLNKTAQQNHNLKIILTSRLNYLQINDPCLDRSLVCQLSVLTDEQIREYAVKHKKFYPNNNFLSKIDDILDNTEYLHIKELLQQAVLIYFISIANIDIEEKDSKANIYNKIFESLAKRSWDKQSGQLDYIKSTVKKNPKLYTKYLRTYLKNIAFYIYQSPNLYITLNELSELESTKNFINKCFNEDLFSSEENIKEINKYLLISFYFQESSNNKTTETAIEFFHNSLWEYLTAEYMWDANKNLLLKKDDDDEYESVSKEEYFNLLNRLIGQKQLSHAIQENLSYIIDNEEEDIKQGIYQQSIKIFYKLSDNNFMLEYTIKNNKLDVIEKASSIFNLFWDFICFSNLNLKNKISTNANIINFLFVFERYFSRDFYNVIFDEDLGFINVLFNSDIENCEFNEVHDFQYIVETKINNSIFDNCRFYRCRLGQNNFTNVTFSKCNFEVIEFIGPTRFANVKFIDTEVPSEDWFQDLLKKNELDDLTKNSHQIDKVIEKTHNEIEVTKYYLRYIGA